jgi:Ni/Co efflux regulator RcnB
MRKFLVTALVAATALTGALSAGAVSAQPRPYGYQDDGRYRDSDRDGRPDYREWNRDRDRDGRPDQYDRNDRRDRDRYSGSHRYYGGRYGYDGYRGQWRTGYRYPHYNDRRYVISDYRAYRLPPPRAGYRYYRDDNGDVVMAAIATGIIGLIVAGALSDNDHDRRYDDRRYSDYRDR